MARNKLAKPVVAKTDPDARNWAICPEPACGMEIRLTAADANGGEGKVIVDHRRWDTQGYQMIPCKGSLMPPVQTETVPKAVFTD